MRARSLSAPDARAVARENTPAPAPEPAEPAAPAIASPAASSGDAGASDVVAARAGPSSAYEPPSLPAVHRALERQERDAAALASLRSSYLKRLRERVAAHRQYPYQARRAGIEGNVCVQMRIDSGGRLTALRSTCGAPSPQLLEAALDAVRAAAPFEALPPGLAELDAELPIVFRLTPSESP